MEETNLEMWSLLSPDRIQIHCRKCGYVATWWGKNIKAVSRSCSSHWVKQEHPTWVQDAQTGSRGIVMLMLPKTWWESGSRVLLKFYETAHRVHLSSQAP